MVAARQVSGALSNEHGEPVVGTEHQGISGEGGALFLSFLTGLRSLLLCPWAFVEVQENADRTKSEASVTSTTPVPSTSVDVRDTHGHVSLFLGHTEATRESM